MSVWDLAGIARLGFFTMPLWLCTRRCTVCAKTCKQNYGIGTLPFCFWLFIDPPSIQTFHFSSCMGLRQLVIEASVGDLVSPAGGKLKSMLHCSMLSCKKADFRVYVKLILAHPNLEVSMFSFYSTIKMLIYVCKCIHKFCCSSYVLF